MGWSEAREVMKDEKRVALPNMMVYLFMKNGHLYESDGLYHFEIDDIDDNLKERTDWEVVE